MNPGVRAVADAVLYEGFLLFPYAKRALKNQMPFQFGVVMPQGYQDESEPTSVRSQFVFCPPPESDEIHIEGVLRFLRIADDPIEEEVAFAWTAGTVVGLCFERNGLRGEISVDSERVGEALLMTVEIVNHTATTAGASRNEALRGAFVSTHLVFEADAGGFASMLDPPEAACSIVARCVNDRLYPILAGERIGGEHWSRTLLISPIILEDFPRIAAASRTQTFDGTEIDELLMLNVASLTDEEKHQARAAHPYVRTLVERAEALDRETLQTLHGEIRKGSRVRVHPKRRADIWDDLVRGMTARVNAIETDIEGNHYVGVVFDDDPASELHEWYGRSFFYGTDEVEPVP